MSPAFHISKNHFISNLPKVDLERWQHELKLIDLHAGNVLFEVGDTLTHIYFPTTTIISIARILIGGELIEVAMIGPEGLVGTSSLLGNSVATNRGIVLQSGKAYRLCSSWIKKELENSTHLMKMMLNFTQALITQMSQIGACNCHHSLEQRLCRWLLVFAELADTTRIMCTQEQLANTLGARRERLTKAASVLKKKGMIQYTRGNIQLLDKQALENHACECYGVIKAAYTQLATVTTYR